MVSTLLYLVVFDLIGVVVCFFFDVASALPGSRTSTALFYAVWMVLGIFCGMLSYNTGGNIASESGNGDWTSREGAGKTGLLVVLVTSAIVVTLSILCYRFLWRYGVESSFFVPDNAAPTLTFFVAILASIVAAHNVFRPKPGR